MAGFNEAWSAVAIPRNGESVSPGLRPLLQGVYSDLLTRPTDLVRLKESLGELLEYLAGAGRTNANCWTVDLFFGLSQAWESDWTDQDLPGDFHDVLSKMGEALHDTITTPDVARNFDCLPEQLLKRVRLLKVDTHTL
jgi:hypothetical protein